jgi:hypothetical protein
MSGYAELESRLLAVVEVEGEGDKHSPKTSIDPGNSSHVFLCSVSCSKVVEKQS